MRRRYYPIVTLSSLMLLLLFLMAKKESVDPAILAELEEQCEWEIMRGTSTQQLSNHFRWNASLLLSLGLLVPIQPYGNNGSKASDLLYRGQLTCLEHEKRVTSQNIFRETLKDISNGNLTCQIIRNITGRANSCYNLDLHLDEFLVKNYRLDEKWRCLQSTETNNQILTTLQIYKAIRLKKKSLIVIPLPNDTILFHNSTFTFRLFFLIQSVYPTKMSVFKRGVIFLEQENGRLYPLDEDFSRLYIGETFYDSAIRWLHLYLEQFKLYIPSNKFEHLIKSNKVSHIVAGDFYLTSSGLELVRIHDGVQHVRSKTAPYFMKLLLHDVLRSAVQISTSKITLSPSQDNSVLEDDVFHLEEIFGLITNVVITPSIQLEPKFQAKWTFYTATVPYEVTYLNLQAILNNCGANLLFENERTNNSVNASIGLGWNDLKIVVENKDPQLKSVIYIFRIRRLPRADNPSLFDKNLNLTVCTLEQECNFKYKETLECGLQPSALGNWSSALTDWDNLPTCPFGNIEGAWMIPCESCLQEGSCYWSRARWQPFQCRYPVLNAPKLQQCLLYRKLIFIGDSTNRGMMESLLERLDGWLTTSDKIKWHGYRHRLANGGATQFDFDYYPKFWESSRPTLEQTLVHMLRRVDARENDTSLIIGGLDWMSEQHFDTIERVLATEGLSRMAVVIKMSGAGYQTDRHGPVSTARRLGRLSQTARLRYGFRTVDTWNMTAAKFRDFLPGRCRCHFHQVTEMNEDDTDDSIADAVSSANTPRRFRVEGSINQAYTDILAHQLCHDDFKLTVFQPSFSFTFAEEEEEEEIDHSL